MISLKVKSKIYEFHTPVIMGILNVNEDSFYSGSRSIDPMKAEQKVLEMIESGAEIIDIGAMSSRPGAKLISHTEEWKRLEPILDHLRKKFSKTIFSLDTVYSETAEKAIKNYDIDIINDISAGEIDSKLPEKVTEFSVPYIIMHMRGIPENMNLFTEYNDIIGDILKYFSKKIHYFNKLGIHDIIIDPGFGFSKTLDQNYILLENLQSFKILNQPILVGISRKSMINKLLGINPENALNGTTALNMYALSKGADILRVHDVKEAYQVKQLYIKLSESRNKEWI